MAKLKLNSGFSLIEVLITIGVLTTAIVFILQSHATVLSAARLSQDITLGSYLAEEKLWEITSQQNPGAEGLEKIENKDFKWSYETKPTQDANLTELDFTIFWKENKKENNYSIHFLTYL